MNSCTSYFAWRALVEHYSSQSKVELANIRYHTILLRNMILSMIDYVIKMKPINVDSLDCPSSPMKDI